MTQSTILFQDLGLNYLKHAESRARRLNPRTFYTYDYSDTWRPGDIKLILTATDLASLNRRRLRVIGTFLNVPWSVNYAATKSNIVTAIGTL